MINWTLEPNKVTNDSNAAMSKNYEQEKLDFISFLNFWVLERKILVKHIGPYVRVTEYISGIDELKILFSSDKSTAGFYYRG